MTERYMEMISLKTYMGVVTGNLTQIDRKAKYVVINDHKALRYDLLFLMCGEKFQKPLQEYRMPFAENPDNVFLINCPMDANKAVAKLKEYQRHECHEDKVVVYGHFLQAYSCLAGLLEYGVPGNRIVLVEPFPYSMNIDRKRRHNISVFNDPDIYHSTMDFIREQAIQVYSSYYFINWTFSPDTNVVASVRFESKHKMLELGCQAIFFFYDKSISPRIYQVINQAGLVFDGTCVHACHSKAPCQCRQQTDGSHLQAGWWWTAPAAPTTRAFTGPAPSPSTRGGTLPPTCSTSTSTAWRSAPSWGSRCATCWFRALCAAATPKNTDGTSIWTSGTGKSRTLDFSVFISHLPVLSFLLVCHAPFFSS